MSDYISKQEAIDRLSEVLSSEGEFEKAKQVIIEAPTLDEKEIIRKPFERVVERLEEELKIKRTKQTTECIKKDGFGTPLQSKLSGNIEMLLKAIKIIKEECGINE